MVKINDKEIVQVTDKGMEENRKHVTNTNNKLTKLCTDSTTVVHNWNVGFDVIKLNVQRVRISTNTKKLRKTSPQVLD